MTSTLPAPEAPSVSPQVEGTPSGRMATTKYRRGIETRERVIALAKKLIAEHGYTEVTLDQIAAVAAVSKSSLLWHFGSKERLLAEAAISLFKEVEEALELEDQAGKSVPERLDDIFTRVSEYFTRNPETKGVVLALLFSGNAPQSVREYIREAWAGHVRVLVDKLSTPEHPMPPEMARVIVAIFHGCYCHWYANGQAEPLADYMAPARTLLHDWLSKPSAPASGT